MKDQELLSSLCYNKKISINKLINTDSFYDHITGTLLRLAVNEASMKLLPINIIIND